MAVNDSRSMLAELAEGRTDGSLRKPNPDRGGSIDAATTAVRETLHPDYGYGYISDPAAQQANGEEFLPR